MSKQAQEVQLQSCGYSMARVKSSDSVTEKKSSSSSKGKKSKTTKTDK